MGQTRRVRIEEIGPGGHPEVIAASLRRSPHLTADAASWTYDHPEVFSDLVALVARDDDGALLGHGRLSRAALLPDGTRLVAVSVLTEHEGQGVGSALHEALLARVPADTTELRSSVHDDEPGSLAVAEHWGYAVQRTSICSQKVLADLPTPAPGAGVTLESVPDLRFAGDDADAVEAMLLASQTNPEAAAGQVATVDSLRALAHTGDPVAVLARVDGSPAAITVGDVTPDGTLFIAYTGVDPARRGHGLARLVKEQAHLDGARLGGRVCVTENEAGNAGIRRINAELGYEVRFGTHYLVRRPAPPA